MTASAHQLLLSVIHYGESDGFNNIKTTCGIDSVCLRRVPSSTGYGAAPENGEDAGGHPDTLGWGIRPYNSKLRFQMRIE